MTLASIGEVGSLYSLPPRPGLASEMAPRRATGPSTTTPVRTSAVLEAAGLAAAPTGVLVTTTAVRG
jgi:hypothetical protein